MATETNATMEVDSDDGDDASLNFGSDSGNEEIDTEKSSSDDGKENATPEVDAKSDTGSKSKRENSDQASAGSSEVTIGDDEGPNKGSGGGSSSSSKRQKTSVVDAQGNITCDVSTMGHAQLLAMVVKQQEEMKKMREQLSKKNSSSSSKKKTPSKPKTPRNKSMKVIENNMERLDDLDLESKKKALDSIGIDNERELANAQGLQILLWELGCNYCLQAHQFLAVRAIAVGISDHEFPGPIDLATADAKQATKVLKNSPWRLSNKGFLIGDVMGLGKTVEAVAGAMLRNAIAKAHKKVEKPTLICTPNEAVLGQWVETFIKAGIDKNKLYRYKTKQTDPFQGDIFVLCTIYDLQTEARYCFNRPNHQSPLFPTAPKYLLRVLRNQYKAERGRAKNMYARKGESINGVIRSYLNKYESQCSLTFRTFIFDEAHFARNLTTFWGSAAAMIGLHSECVLPMSGTPYNNRLQDIATLMTFVNPRHASARESWWKQATKNKSASTVLEKVKEWNENYLIRRGKDVLARQLPPKEIRKAIITLSETEVAK
jgi:SNF2 family DNA or RNA helicase